MARTLLYRKLEKGVQMAETFWDTVIRETVTITTTTNDYPGNYEYPRETLVDAWCESRTRVEVIYKGTGTVQKNSYFNSSLCALPPCGLSITGVDVTGTELAGANATATIQASGATNLEYSLNNFNDRQDSNVFTGLASGSYVAYARTKGDIGCVDTYAFEVRAPYKVRFTIPWKDYENRQHRVDILDRSYEGAIETLRAAGDPASLEYPALGDKIGVISGSALSVNFLQERDDVLLDLYTADERKFRVDYYIDNILEWRGYVLPEYYDQPWLDVDTHPVISLRASDGIAALNEVYYLVENGARYYGRESGLTILKRCLDLLDLELPFYTAVNIWADGMDTNLDPLAQAYYDQSYYYDESTPLSCGEVLERILQLFNCSVRQAHGAIHIIPHEAKKGPYLRRKYTAKGEFEAEETFEKVDTILRNGSVSYREGVQRIGMQPQITLGRIKLEYGEMESFIENGSFEDWDEGTPRNWTGTAVMTRGTADNGDSFVLQLPGFASSLSNAGYLDSSLYEVNGLEYTLLLSFDCTMVYDPSLSTCDVGVRLMVGTKYLNQGPLGDYLLGDTPANVLVLRKPLSETAGTQQVKERVELMLPGAPTEGPVQIRLFQAVGNVAQDITLKLDNVRLECYRLDNVSKEYVEGENPGYNTVKPFELSLYHGSGIPRSQALITLSDLTPTDKWNGLTLQAHTLRTILDQHIRPTRVLSATITGASPLGVVRDPHSPGARFSVDGYTLDCRTGLAQITALEIFGGSDTIPYNAMLYEDGTPMLYENGDYMLYE